MNAERAPIPSTVDRQKLLFWSCFIALVATAFSFMTRALLMDTWQTEFNLTETEKGKIFGAGLWPFAISIVLFSLVIDRLGYGRAMVFAFCCHIGFAVITIFAKNYSWLWWGSFVGALGNGTVEAVINPVIATVYARDKTKWLNILHAGWPGGLVITGIVVLLLGSSVGWQVKIGLIFVPTVIYGVMMARCRFPVSERVAAGISHRSMLQEMGFGGAFVVIFLMVSEVSNVVAKGEAALPLQLGITAGLTLLAAFYIRSFGRPMFVFLLLVMLLLASTELGIDSWITDLMGPVMKDVFSLPGGLVFIYTATIMMTLRFYAGPIVHRLKPLGLLAVSALLATVGLLGLSMATSGLLIFVGATVYGLGKTFFWPTTLGVVSEQFPRGGAMTLNVIGGVGMLGVGILANPWFGYLQDTKIRDDLRQAHPTLHAKFVTENKPSLFGSYVALDAKRVTNEATPQELAAIDKAKSAAKSRVIRIAALLPALMLACYLGLIAFFRTRGGYRPVEI